MNENNKIQPYIVNLITQNIDNCGYNISQYLTFIVTSQYMRWTSVQQCYRAIFKGRTYALYRGKQY
jgi:hypothetical protein